MKEKIYYIKFIIPIIIILVIIGINIKKPETEEIIEIQKPEVEETIVPEKIRIDIKGEINNPGVYELQEGDRVSDLIKASGGLTEEADTTLINLSKQLKDEMVVIIYNKNTIEQLKQELKDTKTVIEYIEKECSCPDTINDACIKEAKKETKKEVTELSKDNKLSINKATLEELQTLPGIGESKAKAIIKYREENNGFKAIEEIKNISGIGDSTFEKFKDYITV